VNNVEETMYKCSVCGHVVSEEWISDRIAEIQEEWNGHDINDMPQCPICKSEDLNELENYHDKNELVSLAV